MKHNKGIGNFLIENPDNLHVREVFAVNELEKQSPEDRPGFLRSLCGYADSRVDAGDLSGPQFVEQRT
jgi:hypothetical protein